MDPIFERGFIADTYACIRGQHRAVERFRRFVRTRQGEGYVLQCDIAGYFRSVDHEVLASLFANLYLDPLDHFVKEGLRVRHYIRYMDDFILLLDDRAQARRLLEAIGSFLGQRLRLRLNPRRRGIAPLSAPCDFLGYVHHPDGRVRVRRRSVQRLRRRLAALDQGLASGAVDHLQARSSLASWIGLAAHADAFRLSRRVFEERDVQNLGKRLLVQSLDRARRERRGLPQTLPGRSMYGAPARP